ncbi:AraC family transcriptional regulator N-terminal domain-containing protein [Bradyrhizobium sp. LVM 105]|uniref:AraC family transcriptional regulator N-terminal domain-containing protein n=1 Tax=Bradyrhizobium sp. LVM 105 TaxID=2341115 RepID=UPI00196B2F9A|nr:AraC family transcriptional regulator N-terminal domain-containing protein [Bradyrhizobium sp. LVM 105]
MEAPPAPASDEHAAAFVMDLNEAILGCATRAVSLLDEPQAIPLLYPGVKRELCYRLLAGHMALSSPAWSSVRSEAGVWSKRSTHCGAISTSRRASMILPRSPA